MIKLCILELFSNVGRKMSGEARGMYLFIHEHDESRNLTTSVGLKQKKYKNKKI
jgi:hypothetical protein